MVLRLVAQWERERAGDTPSVSFDDLADSPQNGAVAGK